MTFWDVGHAPKDQNNRRKYMPDYAVWEIHPAMKTEVVKEPTHDAVTSANTRKLSTTQSSEQQ